MIRYDRAQRSVIALCACGWREIAGDKAGAERAAMDHIYRAHAVDELDRSRAITAAYERRRTRRRD